MKKITVIIKSIRFAVSSKFVNGKQFRINDGLRDACWLDTRVVEQLFRGLGLATTNTFQNLIGSTLTYQTLTVTQEMLNAGGGSHKIMSTLSDNREIEFKKIGDKAFDHHLPALSAKLEDAMFSRPLDFVSDWASTPTNVAPTAAPKVTTPPPAETIDDDHDDTLNAEAAGEPINNTTTSVNSTTPPVEVVPDNEEPA